MCLEERNTDSRARPPAACRIARRTFSVRLAVRSLSLDIVAFLFLLAFLTEDVLAGKLDALALVGLGGPVTANFGRHLPDPLPVDAGDHNLRRLGRGDRDPFRDRVDHIMAVAERELEVLALHGGTVADAGDLELLLETLGDAGDQVRDQRP